MVKVSVSEADVLELLYKDMEEAIEKGDKKKAKEVLEDIKTVEREGAWSALKQCIEKH